PFKNGCSRALPTADAAREAMARENRRGPFSKAIETRGASPVQAPARVPAPAYFGIGGRWTGYRGPDPLLTPRSMSHRADKTGLKNGGALASLPVVNGSWSAWPWLRSAEATR